MALLHHPTHLHHLDWSITVLSAYEYTVILPASLRSARTTKHTDVGGESLRDYPKSKYSLHSVGYIWTTSLHPVRPHTYYSTGDHCRDVFLVQIKPPRCLPELINHFPYLPRHLLLHRPTLHQDPDDSNLLSES